MQAHNPIHGLLKYQDALTAYAFGLLHDWSLAEDAVQDAMLSVHRRGETFRGEGDVLAWARTIVKNKAIDILRRRKRERSLPDDELLFLVDEQFNRHADEDYVARLDRKKAALRTCLSRISEKALTLLLRFYADRTPYRELAAELNRSADALRVTLARIRRKLAGCIRQETKGADAG